MSNKFMIIMIIVFVLILGMMGTGFFFMWNKLNAVNAQQSNSEQGDTSAAAPVQLGPLHQLDTFIVNLADEGGNRYLRTKMNLELKNEECNLMVQERLPMIRNSILMILPTKTYNDIATVEGKSALRDEMVTKLNAFLAPGSVTNIYFTEFVIQ